MGSWRAERRLRRVGERLRSRRDELRTIDEQLAHLAGDADDLDVRAVVADDRGAGHEAVDARRHVEAMRRHRQHVLDEIGRLEARQDELLDRWPV